MFAKKIVTCGLGLSMMMGIAANSFASSAPTAVKADGNMALTADVSKPTPDCLPGLVIAVAAVVLDHYYPNFKPKAQVTQSGVASHISESTFDK